MNTNKIQELKTDELIWIIFITISTLNIVADEYEKKYYLNNDQKKDTEAKKIFILTVTISLLIYIFFLNRNYKKVKDLKQNNKNYKTAEIRLFGSLLIVVGVTCLLYFQIKNKDTTNPSVE
jgi:uncharacterized membrane protein YidH (DUF202 family)